MKNKEIAARVGTTEQVVKNYLRKVYDKLGVADRLELALYCLNSRVLQDAKQAPPAAEPTEPIQVAPKESKEPKDPKDPKDPEPTAHPSEASKQLS
jgi:Bacterial regulatory proteins, luxR family